MLYRVVGCLRKGFLLLERAQLSEKLEVVGFQKCHWITRCNYRDILTYWSLVSPKVNHPRQIVWRGFKTRIILGVLSRSNLPLF
jgi:hypothetical protein